MIETNIKNLSVEEIMQKIKQEVLKRKNSLVQENEQLKVVALQDSEQMLMDLYHEHINVIDTGKELFQQKEVYEYADFTKYHDIEFIKNCYRGLLKREADIAGMNYYLTKLRSGQMSKSEIISILHHSKEGKTKNVKLLGSKKRYIITMLNRIPVLGYFFKLSTTLFTLPRLIKRLNEYENYTYQLYMKNIDNEMKLQNAVNNTFQDSFASLNAFVNTKADKTELETLSNDLHTEIETKADKTELETLSNDLHTEIETKANKTELDIDEINVFKCEDFLSKGISLTKHSLNDKNLQDMYYSLFEDAFYESKIIKEKQKYYLRYIENTSKTFHLDLGCGRGEFLEIIRENNIPYFGIDINQIEVDRLIQNNFNVELMDIETFFKNNKKTFSSISAIQVFEHLTTKEIKDTIKNIFKSLETDGVAIIETVNPHSYFAFGGFYMDETHIKPIPPEQLTFLMQWYGFKDIEIVYSSKLPGEFMVTDLKRNYYDYALIGYKR